MFRTFQCAKSFFFFFLTSLNLLCWEEDIIDSTLGQAAAWYYPRQHRSKQMDERQYSRHRLVPCSALHTQTSGAPATAFITPQKGQKWLSTERARMCVQSCSTLCDSMDCSLPGSSVHKIFQERILEWTFLQGILPSQELNSCLLHPLYWQAGFLPLNHLGIPAQRMLTYKM